MKLSKTLFKQYARCSNFPALYDIYIHQKFHHVKKINGFELNNIISNLEDLSLDFEVDNEALEIISSMFDGNGEDLLNNQSDQLLAFSEVFTKIEELARRQIEKTVDGKFVSSNKTKEQKKYSYDYNFNTYYCYLDIYVETNKDIKVFEVKATTDRKYKELIIKDKKETYPLFYKDKDYLKLSSIPVLSDVGKQKWTKKRSDLLNRFTDVGKYLYDIAIEKHIVDGSINHDKTIKEHLPVHYYLVVLNSEYIFDGTYQDNEPVYQKDTNNNELFTIIEADSLLDEYQPIISEDIRRVEKFISRLEINNNIVGPHCEIKKTTACPFKKICFKCVSNPHSVLETMNPKYAFDDYKGIKHPTVYDFINDGIYEFKDAYKYTTKPNYKIQYDAIVNNQVHLDEERIKKALEQLKYPIYHLDFESFNNPIPRYSFEFPYMQSLFQYSLHIEKKPGICDIEKDHFDFLAKDHKDHREELIISLINHIDLSKGGSVMVYNENFEKTRLYELAKMFPKYKKELLNIRNHIVDLLNIIKGSNTFYETFMDLTKEQKDTVAYYHKNLYGSYSIKKVLPIFTDLSYQDLEVKKGTEAVLVYSMFPNYSEEEFKKEYAALRIYCRQDTWSMVEILRGLRKMVLNN